MAITIGAADVMWHVPDTGQPQEPAEPGILVPGYKPSAATSGTVVAGDNYSWFSINES